MKIIGLQILELSLRLKTNYYDMLQDFIDSGEQIDAFGVGYESFDFENVLRRLDENALGINLSPHFVPNTTFFFLDSSDVMVGFLNLRHFLNDWLTDSVGHVGYAVRPSLRGLGYSNIMLSLGLKKAKLLGIKVISLHVDSNNIASKKVILNNGGEFKSNYLSSKGSVENYLIYL